MIKVILLSLLIILCNNSCKSELDYDSKVRDTESRFEQLYQELD